MALLCTHQKLCLWIPAGALPLPCKGLRPFEPYKASALDSAGALPLHPAREFLP